MSSPLKLTVMTGAEGEPSGFDSAIALVPGDWYAVLTAGADGPRGRVLLLSAASRALRDMSGRMAEGIGERLHHADWTITGDPDEVTTLGLMHDCPTCRAAVDQAVAHLREHPEAEMAVGQLWWAGQ